MNDPNNEKAVKLLLALRKALERFDHDSQDAELDGYGFWENPSVRGFDKAHLAFSKALEGILKMA